MMRRSSATAARRRPSQASRSARSCGIGDALRVALLPALEGLGEAALLVLVELRPARRLRRACRRPWCTRRRARRAPRRSGASYSASIALRVLLDRRQLPEERLAREQVLERRGARRAARRRCRTPGSGRARGSPCALRARSRSWRRGSVSACSSSDGALDRVLDGAVAGVERGDGVVLGAPQDRLHLAEGAVEHRAAGQAMRGERRERRRDGVLVARDLACAARRRWRRRSAPSPRCRRCRGRPPRP